MQRNIVRFGASVYRFFRTRRPLVFFTGLFLLGCVLGVGVFCRVEYAAALAEKMLPAPVTVSWEGILRAIGSSCFFGWLMLLLLYLVGLSPCGVFVAVLVPFFYGMGVGITESALYAQGFSGVLFSAVFLVPHTVFCAAALLLGSCETAHMSAVLGKQLFSSVGKVGETARCFRFYSLRFLILAALVLIAGILNALVRMVYYPLG